MRKQLSWVLVILLGLGMLAGCSSGTSAQPSAAPGKTAAAPAKLTITFSNSTDYIFNEIYISPTAANDWGAELLGSTRILKGGGSLDVDITAYDYDNYDIRVVDEDKAEYFFTYVPLQNGSEVGISFGDEGLTADVYDQAGNSTATVSGSVGSGSEEASGPVTTGTGYDTNGAYSFTIYNESSYDIYAIYMGPTGSDPGDDGDILPSVLDAGENADVSGTVEKDLWGNTEWTLYILDVDGDTSASYDEFNPWLLNYVDVQWNNDSGGYVCEFVYSE